jgi:hypothetical protein
VRIHVFCVAGIISIMVLAAWSGKFVKKLFWEVSLDGSSDQDKCMLFYVGGVHCATIG